MDLLNLLLEDRHSQSIARDIISEVLDSFDVALEDSALSKLAIPIATDMAMEKLHILMKLAMIKYDGESNADVPFEKMDADGEPYPGKIDSWARGTGIIHIKYKFHFCYLCVI